MKGFTWILAVFALLVIGSTAEECRDKTPRLCNRFKNKHCSGKFERDVFKKRCKKSCGLCENSESTQVTTDKEGSESTQETTDEKGSEECKDKSPNTCAKSDYKNKYCSGEYEWDWFKEQCMKSCNLCGTSESTQNSTDDEECKDEKPLMCSLSKDKFCSGEKEWDWFKERCKKSCNLCGTSESSQEITDKEGTESTQDETDEKGSESTKESTDNDGSESTQETTDNEGGESTQETGGEECKDETPLMCSLSKDKFCSGEKEWDWFQKQCKKSCNLCGTGESTQETTDKEGSESTQGATDNEGSESIQETTDNEGSESTQGATDEKGSESTQGATDKEAKTSSSQVQTRFIADVEKLLGSL